MKPPLTDDRRERIESSISTLHGTRMWHENRARTTIRSLKKCIIAFLIIAILCAISTLVFSQLFLNQYSVSLISFVVCILSSCATGVFTYAAMNEYNTSCEEPILFYNGASLWLISPDNSIDDKPQESISSDDEINTIKSAERQEYWNKKFLDRYDMIQVRENTHGPLASQPMCETEAVLHIAHLVEERQLGNNISGWTLDNIEEIESVSSDEEEGTTSIIYTDALSGDRRTIIIDSYGWRDFIKWLSEMDPENVGNEF